jgi:hypothetical protein
MYWSRIIVFHLFKSVLPEFDHYLAIYIFFTFAIAIWTSEGLGSGNNDSPVCNSVCLTSLTLCIFNNRAVVLTLTQNDGHELVSLMRQPLGVGHSHIESVTMTVRHHQVFGNSNQSSTTPFIWWTQISTWADWFYILATELNSVASVYKRTIPIYAACWRS